MAIIFNIGLNDKDLHKQVVSDSKAIEIVRDTIGDCTISSKIGIYKGEIEKSFEVISYDMTLDVARKICVDICRELNQESVYLTEINQESECVYA